VVLGVPLYLLHELEEQKKKNKKSGQFRGKGGKMSKGPGFD
jgi:hypothetical protein